MSESTDKIRVCFEAFTKGSNKVATDQAKLNGTRTGTYVNGVLAAVESGDRETFETAIEAFMQDIRDNTGSYARKLGCSVAKKQPKGQPKNKPVYTVPGAVMSLKSVMLGAFDYGLDIGTLEDPRPFSQIRKEYNAIRAEEKREALTGDDKTRAEIAGMLESIAANLSEMKGDDLDALHESVADAVELSRVVKAEKAEKTAKVAAKLAKAA